MEGRLAEGEEPPADANSFEVPQGSPEELLSFIEEIGKRAPPENVDRRQYVQQALGAIVAAAEQILLADDVPPALAQRAIGHEGNALRSLAQLDPGQAMRSATQLQQHVQRLKLADLERPVAGLVLQVRLLGARSPAEAEQTLADITRFAAEGPLGAAEMQLVATAGQIAAQLPGDAALTFHREVGQRLADSGDAAAQQLGAQMLGSARRMGLVGDSMRLEGVGLDGSKFDPSVLDGKVVLVDFWATWCGPCIAEMANIRQNYERYHERGFEVVGVSVDQNLADLEKFMGENDVPWIILADNHAKIPDSERLGSYYGISAIPTTILIGRDGKVITLQCRGPQLAELLEKHL
jgi:peroxiredoxin